MEQYTKVWIMDGDLKCPHGGKTQERQNRPCVFFFGYGDGGYLQACISINGKRLNVHVHRCVAETYLPNECGYEIVNHLDGCKQHNDVWNLEWCTRKENYFHAVDMELIDYDVPYRIGYLSHIGAYVGSSNGMSKLTEADVLYIRQNYIPKGKGQKCNRKEIAEMFGVSPNLISKNSQRIYMVSCIKW